MTPPPNRRSLVATFIGLFDNIRKVFASSPDAQREGLAAPDFGVNSGTGRCSGCSGVGEVPDGDLWSSCPTCGGSRYGHQALAVRFDGTNIQELLETPVEQLRKLAGTFRIPLPLIEAMCDLGIGYLALGRRVDTLSGGEVQRLRLAMRLRRELQGSMLFIMDEPAVGLHARDVQRLAAAPERLVVVSERFWTEREPWELAGLDTEVPKLLLDLQRVSTQNVFTSLLDEWRTHPSGWLAVQPFLTDIQVWGAALPESRIRFVKSHIAKERLGLITATGGDARKDTDVRDLRATGERFKPGSDSDGARHQALRDAFAVGAHYVELRDGSGRLRATASDRLVELKAAIVGPMSPVPSHFTRHDQLGRCPMCSGRRFVMSLAESLVIANPKTPPDNEALLNHQAEALMKSNPPNEV